MRNLIYLLWVLVFTLLIQGFSVDINKNEQPPNTINFDSIFREADRLVNPYDSTFLKLTDKVFEDGELSFTVTEKQLLQIYWLGYINGIDFNGDFNVLNEKIKAQEKAFQSYHIFLTR